MLIVGSMILRVFSNQRFYDSVTQAVSAMVLPNATLLEELLEKYMDEDGEWWIAKQRGKRAITDSDMQSILDLHNKLRGQVYPPASNMEYMVQDPAFAFQSPSDEFQRVLLCPTCPGPSEGLHSSLGHGTQNWRDLQSRGLKPVCGSMDQQAFFHQLGRIWGHTGEGVTGGVTLLINLAAPVLRVPLVLEEVVERTFVIEQSSICKAAIHYGILDNEGGWVDVTRQGRKNYFIKSYRNGVQSIGIGYCSEYLNKLVNNRIHIPTSVFDNAKVTEVSATSVKTNWNPVNEQCEIDGKYQSANSFTVSKVTVQAITCETTVEQLCPFQKPASHCPRVYCPHNCMQANPHYARVIGTRIYSDISSICRAAVHAGVVRNQGGYVDVMPVDKRKVYVASFQNGIYSERIETKVQVDFDCDESPTQSKA
ncbi:hypothetical protein DUI87_07453 [Hirundo rustica rustica]|uniref:LCCL domain-containing protein n=1 Tax=Hirundo rustica rustica TaxID=333673 RepID=A0A3M0KQ31_HIRRU|nr:hypothetical protein DUI87_07453 [Hirundo rustica rustica]